MTTVRWGMVKNADYGLWTVDSDCGLGLGLQILIADSDYGFRLLTTDGGLWIADRRLRKIGVRRAQFYFDYIST